MKFEIFTNIKIQANKADFLIIVLVVNYKLPLFISVELLEHDIFY